MKRKLFAALLALLMVLSLLPATLVPEAAAAETAPTVPVVDQDIVEGGAILHCFDWSYNEIKEALPKIKAAGYVAVQTSPVQQPKDYNSAWTDGNQWWKLYQPLGFSIADGTTWLGTIDELTDLCTEAAKPEYGIYVIVDIVANHLANKTGGGGWEQVNEEIDPELYDPQYFHTSTDGVSDDDRATMTQNQMGMPDLNTADPLVQQKVLGLLKECIDCGVDGFRFDAAKHIELPGDEERAGCGSDFWPTVINGARNYAESKNQTLFIYGESLSGNADEPWVYEYTNYMALTDSNYGGRIRDAVYGTNAGMLGDGRYVRSNTARANVVWVESHDTYEDGGSVGLSPEQIMRAWAIVGARADSTALYLARPNETMGAASSDETWQSTAVAEVNQFKNYYIGTNEYLHSNYEDKVAWIERQGNAEKNPGVVISKLDGAGAVNLSMEWMEDGVYEDSVSGNLFYVSEGKLHGAVGSTGVAVVYQKSSAEAPSPYISESTLYFKPLSWWFNDGARVAMYVFNNTGDNAWASMYEVKNENGYYEAAVPAGNWTGVIFVRMNGSTTENNWSNKFYNQTNDMFPDFGTNCFVNTDGESTGYWEKYSHPQSYYLVGNMNGWAIHPDYKLKRNTANEYTINCDLSVLSRCKVVYSEDGTNITTWYKGDGQPDFGENGEITQNGNYNIYFRPDGNGDWNYHYISAALNGDPVNSEATGFYLVGTMTNWKVKDGYKLTEDSDEYSIRKNLSAMDEFKVVYSADGIKTSIWFPDPGPNYGAENDEDTGNKKITHNGEYQIRFTPHYNQNSWYMHCIKVSPIYTVTVENGTGSGSYVEGASVTITANAPGEGMQFATWTGADELTFTSGSAATATATFTMPASDVQVFATFKEVPAEPTFARQSLVLDGSIGVTFYMDLNGLSTDVRDASTMTFTISGAGSVPADPVAFDATKAKVVEGVTLYGFTCYVNSLQMADTITATFHYGDADPITKEYSVKEYIIAFDAYVNEHPDAFGDATKQTVDLVHALADYGHYVQLFLAESNHLSLGGGDNGYTEMDLSYNYTGYDYTSIRSSVSNYAIIRENHSDTNINGVPTYSLVLDSATAIRVFIRPAAGFDGNVSATWDYEAEVYLERQTDGRYRVEIANIPAHELGLNHIIIVFTGDNCSNQYPSAYTNVEVSALSYVYGILDSDAYADNTKAKDAVSALYAYWQAACAYKSATSTN